MSNPVGAIVSPQNTTPQTPAGMPAVAGDSAAETDFKSQAAQAQTPPHGSSDPNTPISPRIVVDPLAGPITEFLTGNGQIQSQIPSAAVVAYLRAGLTSTGLAKPTEADPAPSENKPEKGSVVA